MLRGQATVATFVATANAGSNNVTVLTNAAGVLGAPRTLAAGEAPSDICAARLDAGSPTVDLAVSNFGDNSVSVYYRPAAGSFPPTPSRTLASGVQPVRITPGTLDEPGGLDNPKGINDLAVSCTGGNSISIFFNNNATGSGAGFLPKADLPAGTGPTSITPGDLDDDGDLDLSVVTTIDAERVVRVFRNDLQSLGGGQYQAAFALFRDEYGGTQPQLVVSDDVNQDGRDDLIAVNSRVVALNSRSSGEKGEAGTMERSITVQPNVVARLSAPPPCPGDFNGDRAINVGDLTFFLGRYGLPAVPPGSGADLIADGQVNTADLVRFLNLFGRACR